MRTIWCGVVLVALAACDAGAPTCKDAVAKAVKNGALVSGDEQTILTQSCEARKWSGNARGCIARASSQSGLATCLKPEDLEAATAEAASRRASAEAKAAGDQVQTLQTERDAIANEVEAGVTAVESSRTDAERSAATLTLRAALMKKADIDGRLAAATAKATAAERAKGVHISQECLDNPLAPNCQ